MAVADEDKRQKVRVDFQVKIEVNFKALKIKLKGDSKNISLNGVFIETDEDIALNTPCQLSVFLAGTTEPMALTMDGRVARKAPNGLGVAFESMELESFTQLKQILRYNTGDPNLI